VTLARATRRGKRPLDAARRRDKVLEGC